MKGAEQFDMIEYEYKIGRLETDETLVPHFGHLAMCIFT